MVFNEIVPYARQSSTFETEAAEQAFISRFEEPILHHMARIRLLDA
uniref:Uncharacterized protein n=1 Tax=Arundo donax TaxID=35708 RepID=A0A0A8ZPR2_ARUDO